MSKKKSNYQLSNVPVLFFDGGSRGNPGKAAGAAVIVMPDGNCHSVSEFLDFATNNEAEYTGLIVGLLKAQELGIEELEVKGDSNLVVNQVNGVWKINSDRLRSLCNQARSLINNFQRATINWIPREQNHQADAVANQCMDQGFSNRVSSQKSQQTPVTPNISVQDESPVALIIKLGNKAKFKDYKNLKSGRDEFTNKQLPGLKKLVPEEVQQQIEQQWDGNDTYLAKVYRWYLRGLPPDMAIKKVKTDAEIEENVTGKHPWKENQPTTKTQPTCQYALGDVVFISNDPISQANISGVVIQPPQLAQNGCWRITVELKDSDFL